MKKVFLSLATIAFVAAGSLTVASCGSDDSSTPVDGGGNNNGGGDNGGGDNGGGDNGGGDNGGGVKGSYTFNGKDYELENMHFLLHSSNGENPAVLDFSEEGNQSDVRSLWVGVAYNTDDIQSAPHYYQFDFSIPAEQTAEGWRIVFPNEADEIFVGPVYAEYELQPLATTEVNQGAVAFNTFVYEEGNNVTANETQYGKDGNLVISHKFDGKFEGIGLSNLTQGAKGTKVNYKMASSNFVKQNVIKGMKVKLGK